MDCAFELAQQMLRGGRLDREPPAGHLPEPSDFATNSESSFATKFNRDKSERLVSRRDESKFGSAEYVRRQSGEFRLGVDSFGILGH